MKHPRCLLLPFLLAAFCSSVFSEESRSEFEQFFIGKIYLNRDSTDGFFPSGHQCAYFGGYVLSKAKKSLEDFGVVSFLCDGRELVLFTDYSEFPRTSWKAPPARVLDAVLLPNLRKGERLMMPGECELNGNTNSKFIAVAHLGKYDEVNWKTGVRAAWYPNPETRKIETLSTRNIICYRPTPP